MLAIIGWTKLPARQCDGIAGKDTMPLGHHASRRAHRCDTLIASAVLMALIAGWIFSFMSIKPATLRFDSLIAATTRWS